MTECERIIEQGILPREFFAPEVRNEFYVSQKRKKVWAVELDILLEFDRVCRKHGLKYFLDGGTLLGAVRHKGFIPWDDDVDVIMPRDDYDKMLGLSGEFSDPYFMQTPYTSHGSFYSFIKLRNSNTSAITQPFLFQNINLGMFIDIFVLDKVKQEDYAQNFSRIRELAMENSTYMRLTNPYFQDTERVKKYAGGDPMNRYEEIHRIAGMHRNEDTAYLAQTVTTIYESEHQFYRAEYYSSSAELEFEGFKFPAPAGYDHVLSTNYGDYMTFPPVEKRGTWHGNVIFDPDVPYKELLAKYQSEAWPENIPML
jgi:lipopolysaccharide cholinephosphotransferase